MSFVSAGMAQARPSDIEYVVVRAASDSAKPTCSRTIALPVVPGRSPGPVRPSKMGRWRALALVGVHVLFILHLAHWGLAGRTISPVEPSEAMETLQHGRVNAGAVFFAVALTLTLVFGRFVCGWACHMVALQDLCGWVLKRLGLRPRPFRSRLLVWVPLIAAVYMFIWPTAYRLWVRQPAPPLTWHLTKADFWGTFPGPAIAVLTLAACGLGIVWFLGNKGFCTYACPYGGFFAVLDRLAPARIRVTEACNQCGHCTAECSSNVRVAEEVHLFKMVVDPGCMKCMDCVSVCPNDALYVGWGRPAVLAPNAADRRRPLRYDGNLGEEIAMAVVFVVCLYAYRGLYGHVPFLFSLGLSAITTFIALKTWQLAPRRDATLHRIPLKRGGRVVGGGWAFAACSLVLLAFVAHSALVQYHQARGERAFAAVTPAVAGWPLAGSLAPLVTSQESEQADRARRHLAWVERFGLLSRPANQAGLAWIDLLEGDTASAEARLRRMADGPAAPADASHVLGEVLLHQGRAADAERLFDRAVAQDGSNPVFRASLGLALLALDRPADAAAAFDQAASLAAQPGDDGSGPVPLDHLYVAYRAEALRRAGRVDDAFDLEFQRHGDDAALLARIQRALLIAPRTAALHRLASAAFNRLGRAAEGAQHAALAVELDGADVLARLHAGRAAAAAGDIAGALTGFAAAERLAPNSWRVSTQLAAALVLAGRVDDAMQRARRAAELRPDVGETHATLGATQMAARDLAGAVASYVRAVQLDPANSEYRLRYAFLLAQSGRAPESAELLRQLMNDANPDIRTAAREMLDELVGPAPQPPRGPSR